MGQLDVKDLATLPCRLGPDPAAEDLDQLLRDGKPQSEAARLTRPGPLYLVKALEHPAPVLGRDPRPAVPDAHHEVVTGHLRLDVDGGARWREFGRVVEQVVEGLHELGSVG